MCSSFLLINQWIPCSPLVYLSCQKQGFSSPSPTFSSHFLLCQWWKEPELAIILKGHWGPVLYGEHKAPPSPGPSTTWHQHCNKETSTMNRSRVRARRKSVVNGEKEERELNAPLSGESFRTTECTHWKVQSSLHKRCNFEQPAWEDLVCTVEEEMFPAIIRD